MKKIILLLAFIYLSTSTIWAEEAEKYPYGNVLNGKGMQPKTFVMKNGEAIEAELGMKWSSGKLEYKLIYKTIPLALSNYLDDPDYLDLAGVIKIQFLDKDNSKIFETRCFLTNAIWEEKILAYRNSIYCNEENYSKIQNVNVSVQ